jgi:glutathione peroxidase
MGIAIQQFCSIKFNVKFPMMEKVDVNGDNAHPLWEWMKNERKQLMMARVKWNFEKFLVDKRGNVVDRFASTTTPESLAGRIEELLKEQQ